MNSGIVSLVKFVAGSAFGAALGASVGALMAPKSGEQFQADTNAFVEHVKAEGEAARVLAEQRVAANFRNKVSDPTAFRNA